MKTPVKFNKEPRLKSCDMIAAWPGIGNVSLIVAQYLRDKLGAEEIGEILPSAFFDPIGVLVKDNIIEAPQFPDNKFYFWQNPATGKALLMFIGDEQPGSKAYDLAQCILEVAAKFKAKRIFTFAAALVRIHHTEKPKVWLAATKPDLIQSLKHHKVTLRGDVQIAGLNGLFLGAAKEKGFDGVCLLGEVPSYATRVPNPKAALAILGVLSGILEVDIPMEDIQKLAEESEEEMKRVAAEAMGQFINEFTKPLWEQEEE